MPKIPLLHSAILALAWPTLVSAQTIDPEPPPAPSPPGAVQVWLTTSDAAKKLERQADLTWSASSPAVDFNSVVDEAEKHQQMDGFGASITDPAIWHAAPEVRDEIMRLLFSRNSGIGLNMVRVRMRAQSPSGADLTYDDVPSGETDPDLEHFSINYDLEWKIPMMLRAKELNPELTLMATPWSAPAWMKDSGAMGYGKLLPQYYGAYAQYFVKFIEGWREQGLGISAVTMQNEPHFEPYWYPGMRMEPADQVALALRMGPAIHNAGRSTRIICWDHNFDEYTYPIEVLDDPDARQWIDGSAFHAYAGDPANMGFVKAAHPDKNLYFTEQTGVYPQDGFGGSMSWHVKNLFMIPGWNDSRCTLLWQMALASTSLAGDRPVVRVAADGRSYELFGEYYEIGHFSKFVRKGAYRIGATTAADGRPRTIAYQNPDGGKILVALNDSGTAITFSIQDNGRRVSCPLAAGALATFTWRDTADGNGLAATYYDRPDLTGVTESRIDPTVDFDWGAGTPDPSIGHSGFSARWTGTLLPEFSENYTFHTTTSDGVRLWIDDQLVVDQWANQGTTETSGSIQLTANQAADIRMEYFSTSGNRVANLAWSSPSTARQTIPRARLFAPVVSSVPPPPLRLTARAPAGDIELEWNAAPTATAYTVKRSSTAEGPYHELAGGITGTTCTDSSASAGTTWHYVISASNTYGPGPDSAPASAMPATALPSQWTSMDIGPVDSPGNAGAIGDGIKLTSAGYDIWDTADSFHFTHVPMTGDGTIIARVATQESSHEWAKAGVMMRESLTSNSRQVSLVLTPRHGAALFARAAAGGTTANTNADGPFAPHWVKLVRAGNTFTGFSSPDGITWTQVGSAATVPMGNVIQVGLASSSHVTAPAIASFDSISAPGLPTPPPLAPASLVATVGNASAGLSWNASAYATGYHIKRATTQGGPYTTIDTANSTVFIDETAANDTAYYYVVTALNSSGESATSPEAGVTPSALLLPPGWVDQDIGGVGFKGGASYSAGTFSITGSGSDIWGATDGFNYCYQTVSGNGTIVARVSGIQNTATYAKASVMFRDTTLANSAHVSMQANPGGGVYFAYRTTNGVATTGTGWTGSGVPKWLKLVRNGSDFSGFHSADGTSWTQLGTTVNVPLADDVLAGMAVSAVNNAALNTSVFDHVSITGFGSPVTPSGLVASPLLGGVHLQWNASSQTTAYQVKRATAGGGPYTTIATTPATSFHDLSATNRVKFYYVVSAVNDQGQSGNSNEVSATALTMPLPTGWIDADIGSVGLPGNADYATGEFTVCGSGEDIWGTADAFNFCYRPVSGNSSITARVADLPNTNPYAKAGVMFRDSTTSAGGRYAMISVSPSSQIKFEYRTNTGGSASSAGVAVGGAPVHLRLVRSNNTFSAFYSQDGSSWTQLGSSVSIGKMRSSAYQGFAVCGANNSALNTATFDSVTAFNYLPPPTPTGLTATAGSGQVTLDWDTVAGATSYHVKRSSGSSGPFATMASSESGSYTDTQAFDGETYYYVVSAVTAGAESADSPVVSAALPPAGSALWTGDDLANWNTPPNWSGTPPVDNGTSALFFNSATNRTSVNGLSNLNVSSLGITGGRDNILEGNPITLTGPLTVDTGNWQWINLPMALAGNTGIAVNYGRLHLNGNLVDGPTPGAITKTGGGWLLLGGTNSFTGSGGNSLTFSGTGSGRVILTNPAALPTGAVVRFSGGGSGELELLTDTSAGAIRIASGTGNGGTIIANRATAGPSASHTLGSIELSSVALNVNQGHNATGNATVYFTDLKMTGGNDNYPVTLAGSATISLGSASITNNGFPKRLQLDGTSTSNEVTGVISNTANGTPGAVVNLIKNNTGSWKLSGDNTYTGTTSVLAGTLLINGNQSAASGAVSVGDGNSGNGGAILGGSGTVGGVITVNSDGTLAPDTTLGTAASVTLGGHLAIMIDGGAANRLTVSGNLALSNGTLDISLPGGPPTAAEYVIASFASLTGSSFATVNGLPQGYAVVYDPAAGQIRIATTYQAWIGTYEAADSSAAADPDGDGLKNLVEYVVGGDPSHASAGLAPAASSEGADLVYTFQRQDTSETHGILLTVEAGTDLAAWPLVFDIGVDDASSSPGVHIEENGPAADTVTVRIPQNTAASTFARMKVENAP